MDIVSVSVVIPIYNSATILKEVLNGLEIQEYSVSEVLLIDNNSSDESFEIMSRYANTSKFLVTLIRHRSDRGLSYSYNEAIKRAKTTHLITLQSDCVILGTDGIKRLLEPFKNDKSVVVTCSLQMTPWKVWYDYGFWQKCLFSRHAGKILSGRNGRFCCFSLQAMNETGGFDERSYRTAGEDGDILFRLSQIGTIVDVPEVVVEHLHHRSSSFSVNNYIYKENQLAEAVGTCLSLNFGKIYIRHYTTALLRPFLILGIFIPRLNILFFILILVYSILFTSNVFKKSWRDVRILILPFVNMFLLFSYTFYFFKGVILKKQQL